MAGFLELLDWCLRDVLLQELAWLVGFFVLLELRRLLRSPLRRRRMLRPTLVRIVGRGDT